MDDARRADVPAVLAGAALLGSAFLPWVRSGPGHSLRGHEMIDTVVALDSTLPGLSAARLALVWYLVPALGAAGWIVTGVAGTDSRWWRALVPATLVTVGIVVGSFAHLAGIGALGLGPWLALVGAAGMLLADRASARMRRRAVRPRARSSVVRAGDS